MATEWINWMGQLVCGMQGHENLMHFERGRVSLRCASCGHETPGWDLKKKNDAALTSAPAPRRRLLPHFSSLRRFAS